MSRNWPPCLALAGHDPERMARPPVVASVEPGKCQQCRKADAFPGRTNCLVCLAHKRELYRKQTAGKPRRAAKCTRCGEPGHYRTNCPKLQQAWEREIAKVELL